MSKEQSLQVLANLISGESSGNRLRELLKNPDAPKGKEWFFAVDAVFNDALDIKLNCGTKNQGWTQSSCFSFQKGDIIYNEVIGLGEHWDESLEDNVHLSLQVKEATPAGIENGTRQPGFVSFHIHGTTKDRRGHAYHLTESMTQDEFIRLLIEGPDNELAERLAQAASSKSC